MAETCPKCGYGGVETDRCPRCNLVLSEYRSHIESLIKAAQVSPKTPRPPSDPEPRPVESEATKRCPRCGLLSPPTAERCECGYAFDGRGGYEIRRLSFHGTGGSLFGIYIVNLFLTLVTLGVYSFWGRVKVRRYILSQTDLEGDRFAYHGTGKELLIGWLKAMLVFGVPLGLLIIVRDLLDVGAVIKAAAWVLFYGVIIVFVPFAIVSARRYRLSRISWRGIRFSFRGRALDFVKLFVGGVLLSAITLGLYYPVFDTRRYGFLMSRSYFGNRKFEFDGHGRDLVGSFVLTVILTVASVGLWGFLLLFSRGYALPLLLLTLPAPAACWFWFLAKKRRYLWDHTLFASARFRSTITASGLFLLSVGNLLLLVVTLGFGWPWVLVRYVRFHLTYLALEGPLDLAGIVQDAQAAAPIGEGFASFLDAGFDLG